ncbi:MAG: hypothetical protein U0869_24205 [Chloroflexota bacterium]
MSRRSVLLVGNYLPSLFAARALHAAGWHVIAGDGGEYTTVHRSRACDEVWPHPDSSQPEAFLPALLELLGRRPDIEVVLPLITDYCAILATHRDAIPAGVVVASPQPAVVETCLDKGRMAALGVEAELPVREAVVAGDLDGVRAAAERVGYPCVVRPVDETGARLPKDRKAYLCPDVAALERQLTPWPPGVTELMVQAYVDGPRHNVHFAARDGQVLATFHTMSPRTDVLDGTGLGVETIALAEDPVLRRHLDALVVRLGYTGVGLAQFLVPPVGEPHFLELNPRHGSGVSFPLRCGLDLFEASIELARPGAHWVPPVGLPDPHGTRYAWTSRDLYGLMLERARGHVRGAATRRWVRQLIRSAVRADLHATWDPRDPMPTVAVYAHLLRERPWVTRDRRRA